MEYNVTFSSYIAAIISGTVQDVQKIHYLLTLIVRITFMKKNTYYKMCSWMYDCYM